jgi:transcriptional regulator with XRE-family HTH domain
MKMDNVKVGQFIKEELKKHNITQEQLAEKLGISSSAVSQGLSGKNSFDISNLMEISKILDMDLDVIVNAGEERETNLERMSKLSFDKFVAEDQDFTKLRESDSKELKLVDYLVKNQNIDLISKLMDKGLRYQLKGNVRFMALALKHYKVLGLDVNYFNRENGVPTLYQSGRRSATGSEGKHYTKSNSITEYSLLSDEDKTFVDAVLELENEELLKQLPYFNEGIDKKVIPGMVYFAIQFDKVNIVEFEEKLHEPYDRQLNALLQRKHEELLKYSIIHQSKKCIKYFYEKLNQFKYEDVFKLLTDTGDLEFAKWFIDNFKEKHKDRFHQPQNKGIDNSQSLIELMKNDDIKLFEFSILFSTNEALNKALKETPESKIEYILALVKAGANYVYRDGYSGHDVELPQVSETIRYLLKKIK